MPVGNNKKPRKLLTRKNVGGWQYETVAASQTLQVIGATGGLGDHLARLVITVFTAATSSVSVRDGSSGTSFTILPNSVAIGVYVVEMGRDSVTTSNDGWRITTGAGARVIAIGSFT